MPTAKEDKSTTTLSQFYSNIKPIERPIRTFHCGFSYIEKWLELEQEGAEFGVELNPDFQRGHVWSQEQQVHYIENVLRRIVDDSGLTIRFNCPTWRADKRLDGDLIDQTVCIDGLQRLTAIRKFIGGELTVFGYEFSDLPQRVLLRDLQIIIKMYDFQYRKDLLQFYLDINGGGTPHSKGELERVKKLIPRDTL